MPPPVCTGDCNLDGEVTIDEILKTIGVSLGDLDLSACVAGDRNGDGVITIDEIIAATYAALNACGVDLVPARVRELPCPGGCGPQRIEVCIDNIGPLGTNAAIAFAVSSQSVGEIRGLGAGAEACVDVVYPRGGESDGQATLTIDPDNQIPEINEDNNVLSFPAPNPTACDPICS